MTSKSVCGLAIAFIFLPFLGDCATQFSPTTLSIVSDKNLEQMEKPVLLASATQSQCRVVLQQRVGYVLFHLPFNEITSGQIKSALQSQKEPYSIRYREMLTPADIGLNILGFLFSVLTVTKQVEACAAPEMVESSDQAKKARIYSEFEKERKRFSRFEVPIGLTTTIEKKVRHRVYQKPEDGEAAVISREGSLTIKSNKLQLETEEGTVAIPEDSVLMIEVMIPEG